MKRWPKDETEELYNLYNKMTNRELEVYFNRTFLSIYKKAIKNGLYRDSEISYKNRSIAHKAEKSGNWNGGKRTTKKGYAQILQKDHPRADVAGYVMEHIFIMSEHLGRDITLDEVVHHKNGLKSDNRVENLEVMSFGEHTKHHHRGLKRSVETRKKMSEKAKQRTHKRSVINE